MEFFFPDFNVDDWYRDQEPSFRSGNVKYCDEKNEHYIIKDVIDDKEFPDSWHHHIVINQTTNIWVFFFLKSLLRLFFILMDRAKSSLLQMSFNHTWSTFFRFKGCITCTSDLFFTLFKYIKKVFSFTIHLLFLWYWDGTHLFKYIVWCRLKFGLTDFRITGFKYNFVLASLNYS